MSEAPKERFAPKEPKQLDPPKDDPITAAELAQANGLGADGKAYVAIKGLVYDVTGNKAYGPEGPYKAFVGADASRALAKSSTKKEDVSAEWEDLTDAEKKTLEDWVTFFSKRYNVVGKVVQ